MTWLRKTSHQLLRVCFKKIINFCSVQVRESQHLKRIFQLLYYKYKNDKGVTLEFQVGYVPIHPERSYPLTQTDVASFYKWN